MTRTLRANSFLTKQLAEDITHFQVLLSVAELACARRDLGHIFASRGSFTVLVPLLVHPQKYTRRLAAKAIICLEPRGEGWDQYFPLAAARFFEEALQLAKRTQDLSEIAQLWSLLLELHIRTTLKRITFRSALHSAERGAALNRPQVRPHRHHPYLDQPLEIQRTSTRAETPASALLRHRDASRRSHPCII